MKLEWFRSHKKFVYWILLPVVGLGMAFFGATSALQSVRSARRGPSIEYKAGDTWHSMGPSEVVALRYVLTQYNPRRDRQFSTDEAAFHEVAWHASAEAGFDLGAEETRESLRAEVKARTEQAAASDGLYRKLLESLQLTAAQFEEVAREIRLREKMAGYLMEQCKANDLELFVAYTQEKEVVRLRYKEFGSEELLGKGKAPDADKVRRCYDGYTRLRDRQAKAQNLPDAAREELRKEVEEFRRTYNAGLNELADVAIAQPRLSADMIFLDMEKLFGGELKPGEEDLKKSYEQNKSQWKSEPKAGEPAPKPGEEKYKPFAEVKAEVEAKWKENELRAYYERNKPMHWKASVKPGEPQPKAGEEKFKPFDEVKAEVEEKWKLEQKKDRAMRRMNKLREAVADAEKEHVKAQTSKPEAERQPFDIAAWVKTQEGLMHWATDELTEDQFRAGKREVQAADAAWAQNLFFLMQDNPFLRTEQQRRWHKERQKQFYTPQFTEPQAKEQGVVMAKVKKYVPEDVMPFEAAAAGLAKRLQLWGGVQQVRAEWAKGEVPPLESLDEVRGNQQDSRHALVRQFFASPKAAGEVLEAAVAPAGETGSQKPDGGERFYIGFAVDRELPAWEQFHHDLGWKRDDERKELVQSHYYSRSDALRRWLGPMMKVIGTMRDPPLFEQYRRGGPIPDDDY